MISKYKSVYETSAYKYAYDIINNNILACKDTINSCNRFIKDLQKQELDNYEFYFDLEQYEKIERVTSKLKFAGGEKSGEIIKLVPPQMFMISNLFCWRYKSNAKKRRFRSAMLMIPRKNAKSFLCSIVAILAMLDEDYGESYSAASKHDQAKLSFTQCKNILKSNPKVSKKFKILENSIENKKRKSIFKALSSNYNNLDGISPNFVLLDGAFVMDEGVRNSTTSGFGQRLSPLVISISTSYDVKMEGNWAYDEMIFTKKVNSGDIENERHFGVIYSLDDEKEVEDPNNWIKANPLIEYVSTLKEDLEEEYKKAKHNASLYRNFKIKRMNLILDGTSLDRYIKLPSWIENEVKNIDLKFRYVFYGVDLSLNTDLSACSICVYNPDEDIFEIKAHAFLPKANIIDLEARDGIKYRELAQKGYITLCEGEIVDYEDIIKYILNNKELNIYPAMVAYDPYNSDYLLKRCEELGIPTLQIRQGFNQLSGPTKLFRNYVYNNKIIHEHNPILNWCVRNAITDKDRFNNEILDKRKSKEKIDLLASSIFAFKACDKEKWNYINREFDDSYTI